MHKFTPGPWEVVDADDETPSHYICPVASNGYGHTGDRYMRAGGCIDIHDARLIAAAPELLVALIALDEAFCSNNDTREERHKSRLALIAARAAIAKATGAA